jgi:signal transduction histidine kinase
MPTKKNTRVQKTKQIPEQDSIKEFYRKILLLQEEERRRISRDLHDETGQMVIALGASLNVLERAVSDGFKDRALNVITDNRKLIQEIATKMKSMALNLRPPTLDILGLSAVLREYFSQCTKSNPVKITFNENIKDIKLDENVEITLYRIIQEAMFNVFKHSKAGAVKVDLFMTKDKLQLSIEDNGVGFNVKDLNTMGFAKMGLRGIQERVAILKGAFNIESYEGKGTKLIIILEKEGLTNAD